MSRVHSCHVLIASLAFATSVALWPAPGLAQAQSTPAPRQPAPSATSDDRLEDQIAFKLETDDVTRTYDFDIDVAAGVVTLSGDVANARQKARAVELAKVAGVTRVDDKIEIDPDVDRTLADRAKRGLNRAGEAITDAWITTKVRWFFVGEDLLDDSDIDVDTADRVVTLKGTIKSEAGRARAKLLAERTDGVRSVRDELVVKP